MIHVDISDCCGITRRAFYKTIPDMATNCWRAHNMWRFQRSFLSSISTFSAIERKSQGRQREWNLGGEEIDSNSRRIAKWEWETFFECQTFIYVHLEHKAAEWDESGPHHKKSKAIFLHDFFSVVDQTLVASKILASAEFSLWMANRKSTRTTPEHLTITKAITSIHLVHIW